MFNYLRKIIWDWSSRVEPFQGKERFVSLITRPNKLNHLKITRQGVTWILYGHDLNEFTLAIRQNHSPILSKRLEEEVEKNNIKIFWDIGANIGAISLPLLNKFNQLQAVLFEPSAEVAGRLIGNLSNNPSIFKRSKIMNIALSNLNGISSFYVSNETFNSGVAGLGLSHNRFKFAVGVQAYTGDSLVESNQCPIPELIKIDVEGFEFEVFQGLQNTLIQYHPTIIFEHSLYRLKERNKNRDEVTKYLEFLGYKIYKQSDNTKITDSDLDKDDDFIARAG